MLPNPGYIFGWLRCHETGGACRGKRALGSCAAVSASLLLPAANASSSPLHLAPGKTPAGTPVLITHGASDDVVPRADVDATAALLNRRWPGGLYLAAPGCETLVCAGWTEGSQTKTGVQEKKHLCVRDPSGIFFMKLV